MDKKDIRIKAAKTFIDDFEKQLNMALQESQTEDNNLESINTDKKIQEFESEQKIHLSELEEAIADIDEYMETNKKYPPSSTSESKNQQTSSEKRE
ncbi:MAG: hypothetical protein AB4080_15450 [Trichodesmium sp.]